MKAFSSWLQDRIDNQKISPTAVAARIGVTYKTLKRMLDGETTPQLSTLKAIAAAFDEDLERLQAMLDGRPLPDRKIRTTLEAWPQTVERVTRLATVGGKSVGEWLEQVTSAWEVMMKANPMLGPGVASPAEQQEAAMDQARIARRKPTAPPRDETRKTA